MSSVLSPVLGSSSATNSSTTADSPSSSSNNSTNTTPPSLPADSSAPPPKSDSTVPATPPPSISEPPPASPPSSPPPPPVSTSPPPADPPPAPSPPIAPPPVENPPPPPPVENPPPPPPVENTPPPPTSKSSPPKQSPPPTETKAPPPSPPTVPPSSPPPEPPPPPVDNTPPPEAPPTVDNSPPPSDATPPKDSPPPPALTPPPDAVQAPPPSDITPHNTTAPPPDLPSSSSPPSPLPPASGTNTSIPPNLASPPLLSIPTEKPIAKPTTPSPNNSTASSSNAGGVQGGGIVAIALVGFLTLSLVVFAVWFVQRRKKRRKFNLAYTMPSPFSSSQNSDSLFLRPQQSPLVSANHSPNHSAQVTGSTTDKYAYSKDSGGLGSSRSWFTYEELAGATNGFSENNLLGEGGFGYVYKGNLADGKVVAVKQLKIGGGQGEREFRAEVEIISRIHHRHLVSLVGYCSSDSQRMLVYDFVSNDTLYHHLHGKGPIMTWANRFKCAIGAARGLAYLHEDCTPKIIHRDIKSANILLDDNFEAKVADFGLARLALELEAYTHVSTRVMGTFGYMAPEYATTGKLTEKSDVFSFGVVLLELITGRKPVDSTRALGDESLVEWARPLLAQALENESFDDVVDHRLENNFVRSEMFRLIEAAAACVRHFATKRPKMSQVARALESLEEISDLTNGLKPGDSQIFDSRQHSAQIRMFQRMAFGSQEYSSDFNDSQSSWRSGL